MWGSLRGRVGVPVYTGVQYLIEVLGWLVKTNLHSDLTKFGFSSQYSVIPWASEPSQIEWREGWDSHSIAHAPHMPHIRRHTWGQIKQHTSKCFSFLQRDAVEGFRDSAIGYKWWLVQFLMGKGWRWPDWSSRTLRKRDPRDPEGLVGMGAALHGPSCLRLVFFLCLKLSGELEIQPEMDLGIVLYGWRGGYVLDICRILLVNFVYSFPQWWTSPSPK